MTYIASTLFVLVGIVNLLPVSGVFGNEQLARLYLVHDLSADLSLLLRHRAVLFGIVGVLLIYAAVQPSMRTMATVAGLVSMVSFCVLAFGGASDNPNLLRVAWIDVVASVLLLVAYGLNRATSA